jgi:hypothetical protein
VNFGSEALDQLAKRTGLSVATVVDLLDKGYTYVERIDCVPKWESPMGRLIKL